MRYGVVHGIIEAGNCVYCGKHIDDGHIFLCEECRIKEKDMKCNKCGKEFKPGDRPDGLQNGISFLMPDGRPVALCCECLIELGKEIMDDKEGETDEID